MKRTRSESKSDGAGTFEEELEGVVVTLPSEQLDSPLGPLTWAVGDWGYLEGSERFHVEPWVEASVLMSSDLGCYIALLATPDLEGRYGTLPPRMLVVESKKVRFAPDLRLRVQLGLKNGVAVIRCWRII